MSINFVINSQLYKDSIIGAYTLFWDSIDLSDPSDLSDLSDKSPHPTRQKKREVSVGGHLPLSCELHLACCLITLQPRSYSLLTPVLGSLEHRHSSCGYDGYDGSYLQLKTSYPA